MRILLTGAAGFLGRYLTGELLSNRHEVIGTARLPAIHMQESSTLFTYQQLDFTNPFEVHDIFEKFKPDAVVHAGAMTRVDECEEQQWRAYQTNVEGTLNLLMSAEEYKSFFVFVSTDFVFDGKNGFYSEPDERNPVNFYGKTKLEAEDAVMEYQGNWSIVRTSLVYGNPPPGKSNILTVIKDKLIKGETYNVVDDQLRTPTYVEDLAAGISTIIDLKTAGIYHLSGKDILSPFAMAIAIATYLKVDPTKINRVTADTFSQPAKRPAHTNLVIEKARMELNYDPVSFEEGLKKALN